jgi:hypothetical protein
MSSTKKLEEISRLKLSFLQEKLQRIKAQLNLAQISAQQLLQQQKETEAEHAALCLAVKEEYHLTETDTVNMLTGEITPATTNQEAAA